MHSSARALHDWLNNPHSTGWFLHKFPWSSCTIPRVCARSEWSQTLPHALYRIWIGTTHKRTDFHRPCWHTGQPALQDTRETHKLTQMYKTRIQTCSGASAPHQGSWVNVRTLLEHFASTALPDGVRTCQQHCQMVLERVLTALSSGQRC